MNELRIYIDNKQEIIDGFKYLQGLRLRSKDTTGRAADKQETQENVNVSRK